MDNEKNCPDISVIVPVYNVEEYLGECLDSLKKQGNVSLEVIIIDDGSTDSSGEIADEYVAENENFIVYHIENGGLGHARNVGVTYAKGKYIFFVDSDDIVADNTLCNMFALSERNGSDLTICNVVRFNSKKMWASGIHKTVFEKTDFVTHISKKPELVFDTTSWNKLILREFYLRYKFEFPENILYEDIPVTIPMHVMANKVSMYNAVGYLWRVRDGATKSITQNSESMKNLTDRIEIMRILDGFFKNNVSDEKLITLKETKALNVDLNIFANACSRVDKEPALEMMKVIREYISEAISEKAMRSVSVILQQKYAYLMTDDYENLKRVCKYEKECYEEAAVQECDNRLIVSLDDELFTLADRDVTAEFKEYPIREYIDSTEQSKTTFVIHAHAYKRRITIPDEASISFRAYLYNIMTNEKYPLRLDREKSEKLTQSFGKVVDPVSEKTSEYNYDAAGFKVTVDINEMISKECPDGQYKLLIEYDNKYYSGTAILKGAKNRTLAKDNTCLVLNDATLKVNFLYMQEICFTLKRGNAFAESVNAEGENIIWKLRSDEECLIAKSASEKVYFKKTGTAEFTCNTKSFGRESDYFVFAVRNGEEMPVLCENKSVEALEVGQNRAVLSTLKTREYSLRIVDTFVAVKGYEVTDSSVIIKTVVTGSSAEKLAICNKAEICVRDVIAGCDVVLAGSKCRVTEKGNLACKFTIDFSKEKINRNLYTSQRDMHIRFYCDGKVFCESCIYSEKNFKASFDFETLTIKLLRNRGGDLSTDFRTEWKESEKSSVKREAILLTKYPEFLKEPINPKLIVFESMWGAKYSCNPRAIYEYIDKNYPEYECVWILNDERMPVNGRARRVRRFSEEYYHCLATAKYLVNNVNFTDSFVKRKGQIMVQTMHGTPLKTFGLEITQEMTSQDKKDAFLKRVATWNYLIVQGEFMKNKSYDCFRYNGKILKTGYPRTDSLYSMTDERREEIKRNLGLPAGKKIILYTPTWRIRNKFDMMLDLEKMREKFSDEYILLIRIHYFSADGYKIPADGKFIFDVNKYSSVEELYQISDMLITDYSSVMFDYALLDKPMLFFTYDFDAYCNDLRGIYVDFKKEAPGPLLYTADEVIDAIENIDEEMKKCSSQIKLFKEKYLTYENAYSSEKVVRKLIKNLKINHFVYKVKQHIK